MSQAQDPSGASATRWQFYSPVLQPSMSSRATGSTNPFCSFPLSGNSCVDFTPGMQLPPPSKAIRCEGLGVQMTWSLIRKNYLTSTQALRELFFSPGTPEADVVKYMQMLNDQATPLQLVDLKKLRVRCKHDLNHPRTKHCPFVVEMWASEIPYACSAFCASSHQPTTIPSRYLCILSARQSSGSNALL